MTNEEFLAAIGKIESNSGQNINHPVITHGLNAGNRAIGTYGLTTPFVNDIVKNMPQYQNLANLSPADQKQYLEANPGIQKEIAGEAYNRLIGKFGDNPVENAVRWNQGTSIKNVTPEMIQNSPYANKFNRLTQKLSGDRTPAASNIPNNEEKSEKTSKILPTSNAGMSLQDILNDENNPFKDDFKDEEETASNF